MNKSQALEHYSHDKDTKHFFASSLDKKDQAETRNQQSNTGFFTPEETQLFQDLLNHLHLQGNTIATGGYSEASRQVFLFLPPWQSQEDWSPSESPLTVIEGKVKGNNPISHRDILGSLMGLGLSRRKLGDIFVEKQNFQVITLEDTAPILLSQWTQVGRHSISLEQKNIADWILPEQAFKDIHSTVATLRLDSLLATAFSLSRSKASQEIQKGNVSVNHKEISKPDKLLQQGDVLVCRGSGKVILTEVKGESKKGRIIVHMQKYL